jgi:hypothetical protein
MDLHAMIYAGLALAYVEASMQSFTERNFRCAIREFFIATLYSIAFAVLHPSLMSVPIAYPIIGT